MNIRTLHKRGTLAARSRPATYRTVAVMVPVGGQIPKRIPKRAKLLLNVYPINMGIDPALPGAEQTVTVDVKFSYDAHGADLLANMRPSRQSPTFRLPPLADAVQDFAHSWLLSLPKSPEAVSPDSELIRVAHTQSRVDQLLRRWIDLVRGTPP